MILAREVKIIPCFVVATLGIVMGTERTGMISLRSLLNKTGSIQGFYILITFVFGIAGKSSNLADAIMPGSHCVEKRAVALGGTKSFPELIHGIAQKNRSRKEEQS